MNPALWYEEGYKYKTVRDYVIKTNIEPPKFIYTGFITIDTDGTMTIRAGYSWDGPSGPTVDTVDTMIASLVHDALYQLMREKVLAIEDFRRAADGELRRLMIEDGAPVLRADVWYAAVRAFAGRAASEPEEILSAPVAGIPLPED